MVYGLVVGVFGVFFVPLLSLIVPAESSLVVPRVLGLLLVLAGATMLAIRILAWIRTPEEGRSSERSVDSYLAALSLLVVYLLVESMANAVFAIPDWGPSIRGFRDRATYSSVQRLVPHPFLIMTNNPALAGVNESGFRDRDWPVEKPAGTIRIACLGASTTEDDYPRRLNVELSRRLPHLQIEVLNFGIGGWTTVQSLINLVLNVRHYSPDWIIIHHAANDRRSWGRGRIRTDMSDSYRPMSSPKPPPDAFLVRNYHSYALAKYLYYKVRGVEPGLPLYEAIFKYSTNKGPPTKMDLTLFEGNVREIVRVARAHGSNVLVTTQPYSLTKLEWGPYWVESMLAANDALRSVAQDLSLPLADIDGVITGNEGSFRDPVHLTSPAVDVKVKAIADVLEPWLSAEAR